MIIFSLLVVQRLKFNILKVYILIPNKIQYCKVKEIKRKITVNDFICLFSFCKLKTIITITLVKYNR